MARRSRPVPVILEAIVAEAQSGWAAGVVDPMRPPHATTLGGQGCFGLPQGLHTDPEAGMTEIGGGSQIGFRTVPRP